MTDSSRKLGELTPEQKKLLALRLKLQKAKAAESAAAPVAREGGVFPLSFAQQRMWLLDQLEPGSPVYNMALAFRLRGPLDAAVLERALGEMVRRHETLRTHVGTQDGEPVQVVSPPAPFRFPVETLPSSGTDAEEAFARIASAEAATPFRLGEGPLFRARLVRAAGDDHLFLFTIHHVVSDGWSTGVFLRELGALYDAFAEGRPSPLPPLPLQYGDHAARQRERLSGAALEAQTAYWKRALAGAPALLELPTDRPRPAVRSDRGGTLGFALPPGTPARVDALARRLDATPFMVLLAAFQALLMRWSGETDVVVGTPIANRGTPDVEGIIGFFANTLALRGDLSGDPTFSELVARVRETTLGAYDHQDLPFEKLVEEVNPARSMSHTPLFQVMLVLQNLGRGGDVGPEPRLGEATMEGVARERASAKFDLTLTMAQAGEEAYGTLEYAADLWDAETAERMIGHYATLLEGALADPETRLWDLPLLGEEERARLEALARPEAPAAPPEAPLHALFAARAARTPEAVAVTYEDRSLTYAELDAAANRLARHLVATGVRPGDLVGLCVERSLETVVGIVAILKAGAAYLPLDPAYPEERLAHMLEDSRAGVVVTTVEAEERLPAGAVRRVRLDADRETIEAHPPEAPGVVPDPEARAYVIYTSGSTGRPKGVEVTHANVVRLFTATDAWFGFGVDDVWTLFHSYAFDFSVWELWGALLYGGRLVVVPFLVSRDPAAFHALLEREGVTVLNQTPSAFRPLMAADEAATAARGEAPPLALRYVVFGGEALDPASLRGWVERRGDETPWLVNMYGITETTVHVTYRVVREADVRGGSASPIGVPIPDLSVQLLDPRGRLVPFGVVGEMYVGGAGVARGYLGRAGLSATRFVADPFGEPGARRYRSGDLARRLADGSLEFAGRADDQVKVRGFRIELGEIESVLLEHPGVREAVVLARGAGEETRLVAWVVGAGGAAPSASELRAHLGARLPDYMVPAALVPMDALPLTRNGKVDRRALPDPDPAEASAVYVAPRTPTEAVVAEVWAELLGVERVGVEDGFFVLGGHSLLATRVVSRLREVLGVELPLRAMFEAPTLGALAAEADRLRGGAGTAAAPPLVPAARDGAAPLSFAQERLWFVDRMEPGSPAYTIGSVFRLRGALDVDAFRAAATALAARHESLRTVFPEIDGVPVQRVLPPAPFDVPLTDLRGLDEASRETAAAEAMRAQAAAPFDLERGPLVRLSLVRVGDEEHVLGFNLHHVIADGWSLGIFFGELAALYAAAREGREAALPPLAVQYADYAVWQRGWLSGEVLERQVAYWRERLAGAPPLLELPTDRPRPAAQTYRGASETLVVPSDLTAAVHALGRREGATLFMTLLAALGVVLSRLSGQDDVVVGTPIAGRTRAETERLIGLFLNSLALRVDLAGAPAFRELLRRVRTATLDAYAHQDLPFERLLDELKPRRSLSHTPVFQVMLNLENYAGGEADFAGLEVEGQGMAAEQTSKFDLTLYVAEGPEGLHLRLVYNVDLFDAARMRELLLQLEEVLRRAAADPDAAVAAIPLGTEETRSILPDPAAPLSAEWRGSVPTLFAAHAARTPGALVAEDPAERWTYAELDAATNRIANALIASSVRPGDVVAILAHRSAAMARALLGVLKSGAAFLALDPAYPPSRLAEYARIAKPAAFLRIGAAGGVAAEVEEALRATSRATVVLGRKAEDAAAVDGLSGVSAEAPPVEIGPDSLAYLSFTSGTTGTPKAVMGRHGSLTHFTPWLAETFGLTSADRFSLLSGLGHDPLHRDVFTPLQLGAAIVAPEAEEIGTPGYLAAWLRDARVTVAHLTPAMGQLITDAPEGASIPSLRRAFFVGDVLRRGDVERLVALAPGLTVINYYGSTETQRAVGYHVVRLDGDDRRREVIPLGKGIPGVQLLVVNAAGGLAGVGEVGEIWLRSPHVALGYLNDPALTAERFLRNPWGTDEGDRIYRTGDLGRYRPDGEVEPMGRADGQVKVRGFRVELGEIEAALARHPSVRESAVLARESRPGERYLVAYVVRSAGSTDVDALRAHLRAALPEFMVPATFVTLDRLPLTANGKLDRRALPDAAPEPLDDRATAPRTETEEAVAAIWREVLGRDAVGVTDDFFTLGGHSLRATQVLSRVRQRLGVKLPVKTFFADPTVGGLAAAIDARRPESAVATVESALVDEETQWGDGVYPLSFAQQRLWLLEQIEPTAAYNLATALRFQGPLDAWALERALEEIVRRHETLRTRIELRGDEPVQVVLPPRPLRLRSVDVEAGSEEALLAEYQRLAAEEARALFPAAGPFARARLLRGGEADHVLLWTTHHIVGDGWSNGVFAGELTALYHAFAREEASPLPPLPIQYGQYAVEQRRELRGEALERQVAYWRESLAGAPALLELPADRPRPAEQSGRGASFPLALPEGAARGIAAFAREADATPFMVLMAAWSAVLSRWSGQDDVVVGTPIANRTRPEVEGLIGFFANTLALRTRLDGDPSFRALVGRVREATLGAYDHQDLPFEKLVEELQPRRSLSHSPVFQGMLTLQNAPRTERGEEGEEALVIGGLGREKETAAFDLTLQLFEAGGEMYGLLEYATDLFDRATMERLVGSFATLLEGALAGPDRPVSTLPLMTDDERRALAEIEAGPTVARDPALTLVSLLEAQVDRTPDAPAVVFGGERLTYAELDARANRLARLLRARGAEAETSVAVFMERSAEMVVALHGILKAGAFYVPVDPEYPEDRISYMLEDSAARLVLTQERLLGRLPSTGAAKAIALDRPGALDGFDPSRSPSTPDADALAYVIYTSGSTGRPKGAMNAHRGVVNRILWMQETFPLGADDVVLQKTPFSFDVSVWEFFWPLMAGARLAVAPPGAHREPARLSEEIAREGVTTLHFVPSMLQLWLDDPSATVGRLRRVMSSGEALPADLVARFHARLPGVELHNLYGPTEAAVDVTWWPCAPGDARASIPIGGPVANTRMHVLDPRGAPTPVGVPGELFIAGVQVGRGYWRRPGLTAERFVPDPFAPQPGARMYRTGDRARWTAEGELEYLGRLDFQVKIRGLRVELGEIEAALADLPAVREAVAEVRGGPAGERIVAYLVPAGGAPLDPAALREALRRTLPEHMVPGAFVELDAMPLSPSGKVDRKALPAPDASAATAAFVPPWSPTELELAEVWRTLLGVERVGAADDFFALGGHSLLAVKLAARVRERFGRDLPLAELFRSRTLRELAAAIDRGGARGEASPLVALRTGGSGAPAFLVHPAGGTVFRYAELARGIGDRPVFGLQAAGVSDAADPLESVDAMAERYLTALREARPEGPYVLGGWSAGGVVALEMARRLREAGEAVPLVVLLDTWPPREAWETTAPDEVELHCRYARDLAGVDEARLEELAETLRALPPEERLAGLSAWIAGAGLDVPEATLAQIGRSVRVFWTTMRAVNLHRLQPYDGDVLLLEAAEGIPGQAPPHPDGVAAAWRPLLRGRFEARTVPGTHGTLVSEPHVQHVAAAVAEALARVEGGPEAREG